MPLITQSLIVTKNIPLTRIEACSRIMRPQVHGGWTLVDSVIGQESFRLKIVRQISTKKLR